ncbi:hypothetical protein NIES4073_25490 [Kalymmatonema gypsitolerans NIES-4073]|nr:hypothetical protein NIES4073_25490 [Scytonema sp. NIES-4073]
MRHCVGEPVLQEGFPLQATGERVPRLGASAVLPHNIF